MPTNLPPAQLVMPDFSKNPGGFGVGASATNATYYLAVFEEYSTSTSSVSQGKKAPLQCPYPNLSLAGLRWEQNQLHAQFNCVQRNLGALICRTNYIKKATESIQDFTLDLNTIYNTF
jgi:hypothetical protein